MKRIDVKNSEQNIAYPNSKMLYDRYIVDISKYKPLTREKELELFKRLEKNKNDVEAYNKLYQHNLLFVVSVAKRYSSSVSKSSLTLEDLISEGNLGLSVAINHFDYKTGNKLISYAVWHVRQHIIRLIEALDKKEDHTAYYIAEIKSLRNIINNLKGKLESSTVKQNIEQVLANIKYEHNYNTLKNTGKNWDNEMFLLTEILKEL